MMISVSISDDGSRIISDNHPNLQDDVEITNLLEVDGGPAYLRPPPNGKCCPGCPGETRCCELGNNVLGNPGFEDSPVSPAPWTTDAGRGYSRTGLGADRSLVAPSSGKRAFYMAAMASTSAAGTHLSQNFNHSLCPTRMPTSINRQGTFVWFLIGSGGGNPTTNPNRMDCQLQFVVDGFTFDNSGTNDRHGGYNGWYNVTWSLKSEGGDSPVNAFTFSAS
jgi:hypothetical protein